MTYLKSMNTRDLSISVLYIIGFSSIVPLIRQSDERYLEPVVIKQQPITSIIPSSNEDVGPDCYRPRKGNKCVLLPNKYLKENPLEREAKFV